MTKIKSVFIGAISCAFLMLAALGCEDSFAGKDCPADLKKKVEEIDLEKIMKKADGSERDKECDEALKDLKKYDGCKLAEGDYDKDASGDKVTTFKLDIIKERCKKEGAGGNVIQ